MPSRDAKPVDPVQMTPRPAGKSEHGGKSARRAGDVAVSLPANFLGLRIPPFISIRKLAP